MRLMFGQRIATQQVFQFRVAPFDEVSALGNLTQDLMYVIHDR